MYQGCINFIAEYYWEDFSRVHYRNMYYYVHM